MFEIDRVEEAVGFKVSRNQDYEVPKEMLIHAPKYFSDRIQLGGTNQEISLAFCNKLDSLYKGEGNAIAIPSAVVYITIGQAKALSAALITHLEKAAKLQAAIDAETERVNADKSD